MKHMRIWGRFTGLAALALAAMVLTLCLPAQQPAGQPGRAVRLSFVDGQVRLSQGNQVLADQAVANTPLFEGMQLATGDSGKAEVQFEDGSVARLSPDSSMTLVALRGQGNSGAADLQVNSGLVYFEFQGGGQAGQLRALFGNSIVTTSGFTVLRVAMDNPPGVLAVFSGNAHLDSNNGAQSVDLRGGESIALNAANPNAYQMAESIEPDSWDAWNSDRDQALTAEAANQTGASANLGQSQNPAWNDLDANGNWYNVPGQGYVWSPYDAANPGFDPYGMGQWIYTPGYGYLWASGYSWGYLPFSCGAWNFYDGFGWGWAPGMGGCMPWWGLGFYGGPNIGYAPVGYPRITRPLPPHRPVGPRPGPPIIVNRRSAFTNSPLPLRQRGTSVKIAGETVQALRPLPSRPVTNQASPVHSMTPARGIMNAPVDQTHGGQPLRTQPGYSYTHPSGAVPGQGQNQPQPNRGLTPGQNQGNRSGAGSNPNNDSSHHGFWNGNSGTRPSGGNNPGGSQNGNGNAPRSGGNPGGGSPHPSGGGFSGGGGGGSHPSGGGGFSGGGGGGGGGSHPSGGSSGGSGGHH